MPSALKIRAFRTAQKLPRTFTVKPRWRFAFTWPKQRGRCAFTSSVKPRGLSTLRSHRAISSRRNITQAEAFSEGGFTLLELLVVTGIIALLMALVAPAFTALKSAGDVTSAAYTIKGVLEQARTYAKANNTYVWVGFYEENASTASTNPPTPGTGRLVMSIVASKDGTTVYDPNSTKNPDPIDPAKLSHVGKLVKIENIHLPLLPIGTGTGDTFDTRPKLQFDPFGVGYNDSRFGEINLSGTQSAPTTNSKFPFQYPVGNPAPAAQYTFQRTLQFNPRGESSINSTYKTRRVVEIGLLATHGSAAPGVYTGNVVAIQFSGIGGNSKIYRR
jgi:prepilin-type N-terminal cleavage/methylation domain-containing protein